VLPQRFVTGTRREDWLPAAQPISLAQPEPHTVLVWVDNQGVAHARDGATGKIIAESADHAAVIRAALNALSPTGGMVFIKRGTYTISRSLTPVSGVKIGSDGAVIRFAPGSSEIHFLATPPDATSAWEDIAIEGLVIDGNKDNLPQPAHPDAQVPIYLHNVNNIVIRDCEIRNHRGFAILIHYNTSLPNTFTGARIEGNHIHDGGNPSGGIYSTNWYTLIRGNVIKNIYGTGINIDEVPGWILDNVVDGIPELKPEEYGICTGYGAHGVVIARNVLRNLHVSAISDSVGGSGDSRIAIIGNVVESCPYGPYACVRSSGSGNVIAFNVIDQWGYSFGDWADGIGVVGGDALVVGNRVSAKRNGIGVTASAMIVGNISYGRDGNGLVFSGANAKAIGKVMGNSLKGGFADLYFYNVANTIVVEDNEFSTYRNDGSPNVILKRNKGYPTEASGSATIPANSTSVTVNHGLALAPSKVLVTPAGNLGAVWVENITSTSFTIRCSTAPAAVTTVYWYAEV